MTPAGWITLGGVLVFAVLAVVLSDILLSILSVTIASVSLASYFYLLGASYAAVFEAIVAAGLLTVLFLLMVSLTETGVVERITGRKATIVGLAGIAIFAVSGLLWTYLSGLPVASTAAFVEPFGEALWTLRSIDVLTVTILIFVGVIGSMRLTTAKIEAEEATSEKEAADAEEGTPARSEAGERGSPKRDAEVQGEIA